MFVRGRVQLWVCVAALLLVQVGGCVRGLPPNPPKTPVGTLPTRDLTAQPRSTRVPALETPSAAVTRAPAPVPIPTIGPLALRAESWSFAAPVAPTLLDWPGTRPINEQMLTTFWETDVLLRWTHPSPPGSNWYQVWTAVNEPYFTPGSCTSCELEGVTSAQRFVSDGDGLTFSPTHGLPESEIMSRIQTYRVVACNRAGCSEPSNAKGVVVFSLDQNAPLPPW